MTTLHKILQRQINKHFGTLENTPLELLPFLKVISETYDHDEKDRKMLERSIGISSAEMKELNTRLAQEVKEVKEAEKKLVNVNRLYAFISHINQTIVHVTDMQTLFNEACQIAITHGKFELAWIGILDESNRTLSLVAQNNTPTSDLEIFRSMKYKYADDGPMAHLLIQDKFYAINNYAEEPEQSFWYQYAHARGFQSSIILPIKKSGKTQYIFSLFSKKQTSSITRR